MRDGALGVKLAQGSFVIFHALQSTMQDPKAGHNTANLGPRDGPQPRYQTDKTNANNDTATTEEHAALDRFPEGEGTVAEPFAVVGSEISEMTAVGSVMTESIVGALVGCIVGASEG